MKPTCISLDSQSPPAHDRGIERPELPTGTVTFLFTDVEGSTRLLGEIGDEAYEQALSVHRRIVRAACQAHDGVEVDTQGDAFFFAFSSATAAASAASATREGLATGPIHVRIGLHTGTPRVTDEGYVGRDVHFAARVAATGHGGQTVLSKATAELVDGSLTDLGEHRLKDIAEAVSLFQLGSEAFPPLKTISNTNLPRPASSFVGREQELHAVLSRVGRGARLLTLTGPGGSGKTRLALEAAATLIPDYKAGVFWVGLASLRDPSLVTETIAQTLGAKDGLASHIADRELLLLLDNLEQVIEAARDLSALLQSCPNLTLVVTSRELLRISGEVEYPVPPLAEPEAVALFCARSQLEPSAEIAELCSRLDSLPLAVELAAARTKVLTPGQILERLSGRLDLLAGGRDADPRQQTLRATIEWSYDLLSEGEQRLFTRLAVFNGGCTLEAAEEVAGADLDTLQSLVDKSLLRFTGERYWMLETIREYAGERPIDADAQYVLRRLGQWAIANTVEPERKQRPRWRKVVREDYPNLRVALEWLSSHDDDAFETLVCHLAAYWDWASEIGEGRRWIEAMLSRPSTPTSDRINARLSLVQLLRSSGDVKGARAEVDRARREAEALGEQALKADAISHLGAIEYVDGKYASAAAHYKDAIAIFEQLGDSLTAAVLQHDLGLITLAAGDPEAARSLFQRAYETAIEHAGPALEANALGSLGYAALAQGQVAAATAYFGRALRVYENSLNLAMAAATDAYGLAAAFSRSGKLFDAQVLVSALDRYFKEMAAVPEPAPRRARDEVIAARKRLTADDLNAAASRAAWMSLAEVVEYGAALAESSAPVSLD